MENCIKCGLEHDGSFGSGKFCSRSCANSRGTRSNETRLKISLANKGNKPWNTGKEWAWITSTCAHCGTEIRHRRCVPKKYHSECWKKAAGGYRKGSGVGKSGWYKGYWCDSSYELAWVIYQLEHNLPFERNKQKFEYYWKDKKKFYIPDFIQNGQIIEIKGFVNEQTKQKLNAVKNLKLLLREHLNTEFNYVISKYGKDFISLYNNNA